MNVTVHFASNLGCTGIRPARGEFPGIRGTATLAVAPTPAEGTCENSSKWLLAAEEQSYKTASVSLMFWLHFNHSTFSHVAATLDVAAAVTAL
eukprot:4533985-Amphidinium_carterae.1